LKGLNPREKKKSFRSALELDGLNPKSPLEECAQGFGITRERIRQLQNTAFGEAAPRADPERASCGISVPGAA